MFLRRLLQHLVLHTDVPWKISVSHSHINLQIFTKLFYGLRIFSNHGAIETKNIATLHTYTTIILSLCEFCMLWKEQVATAQTQRINYTSVNKEGFMIYVLRKPLHHPTTHYIYVMYSATSLQTTKAMKASMYSTKI